MLFLATDLDGTFLEGSRADRQQLYSIISNDPTVCLVFVTGRGLDSVTPLLKDPFIPDPDFIICDVGATVVNGQTLESVEPLQGEIDKRWPGSELVANSMVNIRGLRKQEVPMKRRSSYFFDSDTDIVTLHSMADRLGCDVLLSAGRFVDVLPPGINKGHTLMQLVKHLQIPDESILVAGDTLNDLSLYNKGYKGVVVGNAEPALVEATMNYPLIYHANRIGCGGILEAFNAFKDFNHFVPAGN